MRKATIDDLTVGTKFRLIYNNYEDGRKNQNNKSFEIRGIVDGVFVCKTYLRGKERWIYYIQEAFAMNLDIQDGLLYVFDKTIPAVETSRELFSQDMEEVVKWVIANFDKPDINKEDHERDIEKRKKESEVESARRLQEFREAAERIRQKFRKRR
jgi:hypothetical protein